MKLHVVLNRLLMFCLTALICTWLSMSTGMWTAIGLWSAVIGALCGGVALLMHRQPPGRVTIINRIAGVVLPWGYLIGRGKLPPIVIESWLRWVLLGVAVIVLTTHRFGVSGHSDSIESSPTTLATGGRSAVIAILLLLSWVVDGAVVLRFVTVIVTRARGNSIAPGTLLPMTVICALIAASVALVLFGHSPATAYLALLLTGGPIVLLGGGYGLFVLSMLASGRHARWH